MLSETKGRIQDFVFLGLIVLCLVLALGGVRAELARRESLSTVSAGRAVDVSRVRKHITNGSLSPHRARFYKQLAE